MQTLATLKAVMLAGLIGVGAVAHADAAKMGSQSTAYVPMTIQAER